MLLELTDLMIRIHSGFGVFQYITLRAVLGVLTALAISLLVGPAMIRQLNRLQIGQTVRDDGPESHLSKVGTPTMGGSLILVAVGASTLFWSDLTNRFVWVVLIVTLAFGAVGWADDYRKLARGDSRGLPARTKYLWQSLIGLATAFFLYFTAASPAETQLIVPFFKNFVLEIGWVFVPLTYFVIVGTSNAVNLTDGLDGTRHHARGAGGGGARHLRLRDRSRGIRRVPRLPAHRWRRRSGGVLRRDRGCRPRIPVVQRLSGPGVHG